MVSLRNPSFKFWEGVVPVERIQKKDVAFINACNSEHDEFLSSGVHSPV
jgi:hypothetical protein